LTKGTDGISGIGGVNFSDDRKKFVSACLGKRLFTGNGYDVLARQCM